MGLLRRLALSAVVAAVLELGLPAAGTAQADAGQSAAISGQVVNGTAGASLPAALPVTLHAFDRGGGLLLTTRSDTDATGRFRFDGLALEEGRTYVVGVNYGGVSYSVTLAPGDLAQPVKLTIYETTQQVALLRVKRQVLVIADVDKNRRQLAAVEFVELSNGGDRTLLPDLAKAGQVSFLRFPLPLRATGLQVQSDLPRGEVIPIATGFALVSPVVPGEHHIDYSFKFPYRGPAVSYRQSFPQGADLYQVLVPARLAQIQVSPLQAKAPTEIGGSAYRVWEAAGLPPGEGITLELSGLPQPRLLVRLAQLVSAKAFWQVAIPSLVGATLALLLLYGALRPRPAASDR